MKKTLDAFYCCEVRVKNTADSAGKSRGAICYLVPAAEVASSSLEALDV